jgi:DNA-binding PadR family transcriptional regulator
MRRKHGELVPLERSIVVAALALLRRGEPPFHGYAIARALRDGDGARRLTAHGTLYRALERLEQRGLLSSVLEDPEAAEAERRPRRRLYWLTAEGQRVAAAIPAAPEPAQSSTRRGLATP